MVLPDLFCKHHYKVRHHLLISGQWYEMLHFCELVDYHPQLVEVFQEW